MDLAGKRVYLAGHAGMVGSAVHRRLASEDCEVLTTTRGDVDLRDQKAVHAWMADAKPDAVIVAAAKVGGILANDTQPADFLYDNLMIEANLIHAAFEAQVEKLLFLGSSCIYPKLADQPMREDALLTGPLEPTNEWYAIAKIAGIKMCQAYRKQHGCDFISAMPTNMYGFNDNFDLQSSHVLPALMVKVHNAKVNGDKSYEVWGSGAPLREFMYADDCADALVHLLQHYSGESHVNVGTGEEVSIRALAETMCEVVGFDGELVFDASKPDGTPRKLMDSSLLRGMGWSPKVQLKQGIARTYQWYLDNADSLRA
ncbi:GDP-L-fucose synthase [Pyruvatibacter sp.]|uniref:GDP-L-fucose synthase n=1 Tax=Pyruvatibacter sp. TaxID=1981328 RepID=UPI00326426FC